MIKDVIKVAEAKDAKNYFSFTLQIYQLLKAGRANPTMLDRIQVD